MNSIKNFITQWRGYEKGEAQTFWLQFLRDVLKIPQPERFIKFEVPVAGGFIDAYLPDTRVIIEQKSAHVKLDDAVFKQAKNYNDGLNFSRKARWIITCNFKEFRVYDMDAKKPAAEPVTIALDELPEKSGAFDFLVKPRRSLTIDKDLNFDVGKAIDKLYQTVRKHYPASETNFDGLNKLCVRLVFCMYAESADVFPGKKTFRDYLEDKSDVSTALREFFKVLNTPPDKRRKFLSAELKNLPYVDGGLFDDDDFDFPDFSPRDKDIISDLCGYRWFKIDPTIFGAVFESVLYQNEITKKIRAEQGIHYTTPTNIQKAIMPLFMTDFYEKFENANSRADLIALQNQLASIKIFDPACGSGNFLTESFLLLRELENKIIEVLVADGAALPANPVKVSIDNFFGLEINDFAVAVAKTALWISEIQTRLETAKILGRDLPHFPLKSNPNIRCANALQTDWRAFAPAANYIISNPPFVGTKGQTAAQKADLLALHKNLKPLDYVTGWYFKAAQFLKNSTARAALVSTNSICQGEQVAPLWNLLGVHIDFAWQTFKWNSESTNKAAVHCVIIGFSCAPNPKPKFIFDPDGNAHLAKNINGYLLDAPNIYVEKRATPLSDAPTMVKGSIVIDDGNLVITAEDYDAFVTAEPNSLKYIRPYIGSDDFINGKKRYCLWLVNCPPNELKAMKLVYKRVKACREFRSKSSRPGTKKAAETPALFAENRQPDSDYIAVPVTSSENRQYIPIGFMDKNVIANGDILTIPDAGLYHFGVLTSSVHMAWLRVVCGRLKSDYRYSATLVYNNFPWPQVSAKQKAAIEASAAKILAVRARYAGASLADLYDAVAMPKDLRAAHRANDLAVLAAYGLPSDMSEAAVVAQLFKKYQELVRQALPQR